MERKGKQKRELQLDHSLPHNCVSVRQTDADTWSAADSLTKTCVYAVCVSRTCELTTVRASSLEVSWAFISCWMRLWSFPLTAASVLVKQGFERICMSLTLHSPEQSDVQNRCFPAGNPRISLSSCKTGEKKTALLAEHLKWQPLFWTLRCPPFSRCSMTPWQRSD